MNDDAGPRPMSNLQLRIISAVVLAATVLCLTAIGGLPFRLLCAAMAAAMFYEWCAMSASAANRTNVPLAGIGLAAALLSVLWGNSPETSILILAAAAVVTTAHTALSGRNWWPAGGLIYAGLSGIAIAALRGSDTPGVFAILYLFAVVWATDILAYFVGRAVGGPKLAPSISPGKTQSGALGGAVGAVVAAVALAGFLGAGNMVELALIALVLSIVSQLGDLFESWVKRRHGAKDSGSIIPGHGGVMDRVDGLVAAGMVLVLIGAIKSGLATPALGLFGL